MKEEVEVFQTKGVITVSCQWEWPLTILIRCPCRDQAAAAAAEAVHQPCKQLVTHLHKSQARWFVPPDCQFQPKGLIRLQPKHHQHYYCHLQGLVICLSPFYICSRIRGNICRMTSPCRLVQLPLTIIDIMTFEKILYSYIIIYRWLVLQKQHNNYLRDDEGVPATYLIW